MPVSSRETRRLGQLEDQVFMAMTRQQAATERLTELAGQVESVTEELRAARAELDAVRGGNRGAGRRRTCCRGRSRRAAGDLDQ